MPALADNPTVWERRDGPFLSRAVLWKAADLTTSSLRSFYADLVPQLKGYRGWDVEVFVDRSDLTRELYGKLATEGTYETWEELYVKFGRSVLPMAELYGYEDNAVMRVRDSAGVCSQVTLAGQDFLSMRLDDTMFDILKIYYHPLPPDARPVPGDEAMVSVYARASAFPSVDRAREFSHALQQRFGQKRVVVHIRTDSYFITDGGFPVLYRFDQKPAPPSREQYEHSRTMYCFCEVTGTLCRSSGP